MIPLLAVVHVRYAKGGFSFWAPLGLVWLLLAPLAVLLAPLFAVGCIAMRVPPARAFAGVMAVVCAAAGTLVEVDTHDTSVRVRLI